MHKNPNGPQNPLDLPLHLRWPYHKKPSHAIVAVIISRRHTMLHRAGYLYIQCVRPAAQKSRWAQH